MNSKIKSIILKSVTIFSCLFAMISLAFGAIASTDALIEETASFGEWIDLINLIKYDVWQASEAFIIISIIIIRVVSGTILGWNLFRIKIFRYSIATGSG